jgi:guanylate kinase
VPGKDYHFVNKDEMVKEVAEGKFIESATFSGNMYGEYTFEKVNEFWIEANLNDKVHRSRQ